AGDLGTAVRAGEPPEAVGHVRLPAVAGPTARADADVGRAVGLRTHGGPVRGLRRAAAGPDRVGPLVLVVVSLHHQVDRELVEQRGQGLADARVGGVR